ncbi:MAG: SRPBCC family protein, partial [Actinobacteria bacterium]|nr:SRPBCC family protein [Actinomycetota bacterium]
MVQEQKKGQFSAPMDRLKGEARGLASALGERAVSSVMNKVEGTTGRLTDYVEGGAGPGLMAAVTGAKDVAEGKGPVRSMAGAGLKGVTEKVKGLFGKGGKGGKGKKLKVTNIVESIDVGVPIDVAYNQWTQFSDFATFMKKVENVEQDKNEPEKLHWKAQVFWSHREWDADVIEQIPEERIIWRSKGQKGHVDGAVTFHKLGPNLTRILLVLEYHPQGFFERTGNLWRAQGRRARLELKHYRRHVMTNAILHPEEIEGWRGVIEDGEVVKDHEEALAEEHGDDEAEDRAQSDEATDEEYADEDADVEDEYQAAEGQGEEEDEETSPNGRAAAERPARRSEGARASGRGRRPSGGP